jgi:RecA-family ATPase
MVTTDAPTNGAHPRRTTRPSQASARVLPHDAECEASILGGIIIRNQLLGELTDLETDSFFELKHKVVFEAMRNLEAAGKPIDVVMLEHEIERNGKIDAIGGVAFLGELCLRVPTVDNVLHYAGIVANHHRSRKAILALGSALERAWTWPHDPAEMISEIAGELGSLVADGAQLERKVRTRWCTEFDAFLGDEEPDDDDAIDWVIRDLIPRGEPALWGGPMKGGKTWAAMDMLVSIALGEKWLGAFDNTWGGPARVLGVLLEDNNRRIRKRLWELCRGRNTTPNDERLRANMKISRAPLRLPDAAEQRRFIAEIKLWKPALVVIDNLTRVMVGDPNSTRDAAAFAHAWTEICEETGACVLFLHHTKKPAGDQKQQDPFDQLRGSNDFGACARNIIVTTPLRTETELVAEVRMRGNLDLRRDSFVLGFERSKNTFDRYRAKLVDRGDIEVIKEEASKQRKEAKKSKAREEKAAEYRERREVILKLARERGAVSQASAALELGIGSPRTLADIFKGLVQEGVLRDAKKRGYMLADAEPQADLPGAR